MELGSKEIYRFGPFELDVPGNELRRKVDGLDQWDTITPRRQAFALLVYLIRHSDVAVSKQDIWMTLFKKAKQHETDFDVDSVNQALRILRKALGDDYGWVYITTPGTGLLRFKFPEQPNAEDDARLVPTDNPPEFEHLELPDVSTLITADNAAGAVLEKPAPKRPDDPTDKLTALDTTLEGGTMENDIPPTVSTMLPPPPPTNQDPKVLEHLRAVPNEMRQAELAPPPSSPIDRGRLIWAGLVFLLTIAVIFFPRLLDHDRLKHDSDRNLVEKYLDIERHKLTFPPADPKQPSNRERSAFAALSQSDPYDLALKAMAGRRFSDARKYLERAERLYEQQRQTGGPSAKSAVDALSKVYLANANIEDEIGDYEKSYIWCSKALALRPDDVSALNNTAYALYSIDKGRDARQLYDQALQGVNIDQKGRAEIFSNMAILDRHEERYDDAIKENLSALDIQKAAGEENSDDAAELYSNLGAIYVDLRRFENANSVLRQALTIRSQGQSSPPPTVGLGFVLGNLGYLYNAQKNYTKSKEFSCAAVCTFRRTLPPQHPTLATAINNLAAVLYNMKQYRAALPLMKESWQITERQLGENNTKALKHLVNLGILTYRLGDNVEARRLLEEARERSDTKRVYEHNDLDRANLFHSLADVYRITGQLADSKGCYTESMRVWEERKETEKDKKLAEDLTINIALSTSGLAALHRAKGQYSQAKALDLRALGLRRSVWKTDNEIIAQNLQGLGEDYLGLGADQDALRVLKEALKIRGPKPDLNNLELLKTVELCRTALRRLGRTQEAITYDARAAEMKDLQAKRDHEQQFSGCECTAQQVLLPKIE